MTLHPQAVAALAQQPGPAPWVDPTPADLVALRLVRNADAATVSGPPVAVPVVRDVDAGGVPARLYDPRAGRGAPVIVYLHGGGWVLGSTTTVDGLCRRLADRSGAAVLSVDYRLAPQHPWPAAILDTETAVAWLRAEAAELGVRADRLVIAGDSAGATVATVVARRARDSGTPYVGQLLVYPPISPPAPDDRGADHGLSAAEMDFYWRAYLPDPADRTHPDADPSMAASLAGMPPTLLLTAEYDVLCADADRYADLLAAAGVPTTSVRYQGMVHGFIRQLAVYDAARAAVDQLAGAAAEYLAGR